MNHTDNIEPTKNQKTITLTDDDGVVYTLKRGHLNTMSITHYGKNHDGVGNLAISVSFTMRGDITITRPADQSDEILDIIRDIVKFSTSKE